MNKTCIVRNTSNNTNVNSPGVVYHGIPKYDYMKRKWLKVLGIVRCHDWHKICSDHFLEENYKPGLKRFLFSNAIPQPYDRYGFPSNYATNSNDVETENNIILPIIRRLAYYDECDDIESEFYREKHIEDAVANSFKSTRRQSILTGNNGDMSNTNMPDHISGSGLRCSVKNCFV